jgi:hypothetical protein
MLNMISVVIPSLPGYEELNDRTVRGFRDTAPDDILEIKLCIGDHPFAVNVNAGLKGANGEIILVSNNDVTPLEGWAEYLHSRALTPGIISMTPRADCGWAFAMTRSTFQDIGYMDEHLINSYDDYDYFIRAALLGYPRLLADRVYLLHEGEHTLSRVWGRNEAQSPVRLSTCRMNREYMLKKWPGLDFDAVAFSHWATHGVEIMREWKNRNLLDNTDA